MPLAGQRAFYFAAFHATRASRTRSRLWLWLTRGGANARALIKFTGGHFLHHSTAAQSVALDGQIPDLDPGYL